jgi:hypothetical protein
MFTECLVSCRQRLLELKAALYELKAEVDDTRQAREQSERKSVKSIHHLENRLCEERAEAEVR